MRALFREGIGPGVSVVVAEQHGAASRLVLSCWLPGKREVGRAIKQISCERGRGGRVSGLLAWAAFIVHSGVLWMLWGAWSSRENLPEICEQSAWLLGVLDEAGAA